MVFRVGVEGGRRHNSSLQMQRHSVLLEEWEDGWKGRHAARTKIAKTTCLSCPESNW